MISLRQKLNKLTVICNVRSTHRHVVKIGLETLNVNATQKQQLGEQTRTRTRISAVVESVKKVKHASSYKNSINLLKLTDL